MPPSVVTRLANSPNVIPSDALIDKRSGKPKRVPKAIRQAVMLITTGTVTTLKAAAERVNLSVEHLSRSLGMPHVQVFIAREARKTIAVAQGRASARIVELIDAGSEHVSLDASSRVLAINGIAPPERGTNVNIINNIQPGYVINLSGKPSDGHIAHVQHIDAKPLINNEVVRDDE